MMAARAQQVPSTPRVTSPTPPPTETETGGGGGGSGSYFAPRTRSGAKKRATSPSTSAIQENDESVPTNASTDSLDSRARSRSPKPTAAFTASSPPSTANSKSPPPSTPSNGHLSPTGSLSAWRPISRSPSPLGLIPIHRHWRSFIHRHEIPRKALHLSIGFVTLSLYSRGTSTSQIHPYLLGALIPIFSLDYARHVFPGLNRLYIRCVGALMRESEVEGWNGVIWYLLGAWTVLRWFPKDVGVMSVLLLSWCDTAASTIGRLYGRYTPRLRKGKSVAGSAAACVVGAMTAGLFWGWMVPRCGFGDEGFMFRGRLGLPAIVTGGGGGVEEAKTVGGWAALGVVSLVSGIVATASEAVDLFGWDDNATIPILSGLGLWGFLKVFAA